MPENSDSGLTDNPPLTEATTIVPACTKGEAALTYTRAGWNVVPIHTPQPSGCSCGTNCGKPGKHPRIGKWEQEFCDLDAVARWWQQWPDANIGLRLDDVAVLDVDGAAGVESLAALEAEYGPLDRRARQRSGSGTGWHYLFEAVPGVSKKLKFRPGLDLLAGAGCYIVVAPSLHASGNRYQWADDVNPLGMRRDQIPLVAPPGWLLRAAASDGGSRAARPPAERVPVERIIATALDKIQAGAGRNDAGLWLFCQLRDNNYSRDEAVLCVRDWVSQANGITPGQDRYTQREADATLRSAYTREAREPWQEEDGKPTHADILLRLAGDFEHFHSGPARDAYVRVPMADHREVWAVDSRSPRIREILTHRFLMEQGRAPSRDALNTAVDTILAKCAAGPKVDVHVRFARSRDTIYLDMADAKWHAIEVNGNGWRVVDNPPVLFRRPSGARALPTPARGGSLDLLRPLVNAGDDTQWCLMVAWLLGTFLPEGAFAHLIIEGESGSAKTTTARILHSLLDPSDAGLSAPPRDEQDATIAAMHAGILGLDNLSGCRADIADVFCRLSTGQGFKTRTLYETLGLTVVSLRIPLIVNGIDSVAMRGDLLERSVVLKLPHIPPDKRLTEQYVWEAFNGVHPLVLGALLDAVSTGLRNLPNTSILDAPRMSDFCTWLVACEPALPWKAGEFLAAYRRRMQEATCDLADNDSVASALVEWTQQNVREGEPVQMIAKDLLVSLNDITMGWPKDPRHWPASPEALAHRLVRLAPVLRAQGVEVRRLHRTKAHRSRWEIWRTGPQGVLIPEFSAPHSLDEAA